MCRDPGVVDRDGQVDRDAVAGLEAVLSGPIGVKQAAEERRPVAVVVEELRRVVGELEALLLGLRPRLAAAPHDGDVEASTCTWWSSRHPWPSPARHPPRRTRSGSCLLGQALKGPVARRLHPQSAPGMARSSRSPGAGSSRQDVADAVHDRPQLLVAAAGRSRWGPPEPHTCRAVPVPITSRLSVVAAKVGADCRHALARARGRGTEQ